MTIVQKVRLEVDQDSLRDFQLQVEEALAGACRNVANRLLVGALQGAVDRSRAEQAPSEQPAPAGQPEEAPEPGRAPAPQKPTPRRGYPGPDVTKPAEVPVTK